ncbi:putative RING-H2 finger protein ATL50 isoform X2 [Nymphaea colorata]|uniref:putative RING-H2 finger protein ATL50 isoform X2 n=1 Tax=Nymphaea colorata TaxID=210225 RepID=UPI00214DF4D3|nr:putative RING-H2 finger protein ATL50 isoform X2 [Nymphaea colorata]
MEIWLQFEVWKAEIVDHGEFSTDFCLKKGLHRPDFVVMCMTLNPINVEKIFIDRANIHELEEVIVAKFPTTNFNSDDFPSKEYAQCSICLAGQYQGRDVLKTMPKCGHAFHVACIDTWLLKKSTCLVCGLPLRDAYHEHLLQWLWPSKEQKVQIETPLLDPEG